MLSEILPRILSYIISGIGFGQLATEWLSKGFWQTVPFRVRVRRDVL